MDIELDRVNNIDFDEGDTNMPVAVTINQVLQLAPRCGEPYRDAIIGGQAVLDRYAISATPLRVAHFLAQVLQESGALTRQFENLRYSPERLRVVWPRRFMPLGPLDPAQYAYNAEKLANEVYGGRMGNTLPGDGYLYRGRGMLQLTGKDSYERATTFLRLGASDAPDLAADPDVVVAAPWCLQIASAQWCALGCNGAADRDDVAEVTWLINGGETGLAERIAWTDKTRAVWQPALTCR